MENPSNQDNANLNRRSFLTRASMIGGAALLPLAARAGNNKCDDDGGGKITRASVTIGGMGTAPSRARDVEQAIVGQVPSAELFRDACESCRKLEAIDDVHAPASYRQHLAAVLSRRALEKAHARSLAAQRGQG